MDFCPPPTPWSASGLRVRGLPCDASLAVSREAAGPSRVAPVQAMGGLGVPPSSTPSRRASAVRARLGSVAG